jgi:PKD domain
MHISEILMTIVILLVPLIFMNALVHGQIKQEQQQQQQQQQQYPPVANAGPDQVVNEGDLDTLNGSGSFDPDGEIINYAWGIEDSDDDAPPISLDRRDPAVATFTAPNVVGDVNANSYLFELTVTDNEELTGSNASKVVVVKN